MNELFKGNSKKITVLIWCTVAILVTLIILRLIAFAGGQFVSVGSVKVMSDISWQIPVIPRWLDIILAVIIWVAILALIKSQEDKNLMVYCLMFSVFGFTVCFLKGLKPYDTIFYEIEEAFVYTCSVLFVAYIRSRMINKEFPKTRTFILVVFSLIVGQTFVHAVAYGVIYAILAMLVNIAVSSIVIISIMHILTIEKLRREKSYWIG